MPSRRWSIFLKSNIKPGDLAWISDEELPKDYRFLGVVLEKPIWREDDDEHMCFKLLSDGQICYIKPESVTAYEEVRQAS
jgi:hypothetical protein